jgi:hypothetical protein
MTREQLEHVIRAAAAITQESSFVVVGSQAVLLPFPNAHPDLLASRELDLYPAMAPEKSDLIEGAIGALSQFDETFSYYADGVSPQTAVMPSDWMDRASLHYLGATTVVCPEMHDLAVSKCVAGREKDARYVRVLFREAMIALPILEQRIRQLDPEAHPIDRLIAWARLRAQEAQA